MLRGELEIVVAVEFSLNGRLQLRRTIDWRVLRSTIINCGNRRVFDHLRRIEVGLAGAEIDDVVTLGTQLRGQLKGRACWRRLDACHAFRN